MDLEDYFRFAVALILVLGLIGLLALIAKRFGMVPRVTIGRTRGDKRVNIVDVTNIDGKRRLILVRRDDTEHLILLGVNGETVIESAIEGPGAPAVATARAATDRAKTVRAKSVRANSVRDSDEQG